MYCSILTRRCLFLYWLTFNANTAHTCGFYLAYPQHVLFCLLTFEKAFHWYVGNLCKQYPRLLKSFLAILKRQNKHSGVTVCILFHNYVWYLGLSDHHVQWPIRTVGVPAFMAIWLAVPRETNGAHLGDIFRVSYLFFLWDNLVWCG